MHPPYHDLENSCLLTLEVNVTFKNLTVTKPATYLRTKHSPVEKQFWML